ncbi:unnamed protein product, partial [marine sediment metagenome]
MSNKIMSSKGVGTLSIILVLIAIVIVGGVAYYATRPPAEEEEEASIKFGNSVYALDDEFNWMMQNELEKICSEENIILHTVCSNHDDLLQFEQASMLIDGDS